MLHALWRGATYLCLGLVRASISNKLRFHAFVFINPAFGAGVDKFNNYEK